MTKNVLAMHDLSGFGRCALTVIIPTLSALGVQVTPVPTAVMSTHTGGYDGFTFADMTDTMLPAAEHYSRLGLHFDAVYIGFLGGEAQLSIIDRIIGMNGTAFVLVDPVMGDDGQIYKTYTAAMCDGMRRLCKRADMITPNVTEACLLTDTEYRPFSGMDRRDAESYADTLLTKLGELCRGNVVMTGVEISDGTVRSMGCAVKSQNGTELIMSPEECASYPGTGDIFASVLLGAMLTGDTLTDAARLAVDFTHTVIRRTMDAGTPSRYGVLLEQSLTVLTEHYAEKANEEE